MSQKIANPITAEFIRDQAKLDDAADDCTTQPGGVAELYGFFHDYESDEAAKTLTMGSNSSPLAAETSSQLPEMSQKIANPVTAEFIRDQAKLDDAADDCTTQPGGVAALLDLFQDDADEAAKTLQDQADKDDEAVLKDEADEAVQYQPDDYDNDIAGISIYPISPGDPGYVNSTENTMVLGNSTELTDCLSNPATPKIRTQYATDPFPSDATYNQLSLKAIHHSQIFQYLCNVAFHVHNIPRLESEHYSDKFTRILKCLCGKFKIKATSTDRTQPVEDRTFRIDPTFGTKVVTNKEEIFVTYELLSNLCTCDKNAITLKPSFLATMPLFHSWMQKSLHPLRKHYTFKNVVDKLNDASYVVEFKAATYTDVKFSVINYICKTISEEYKYIPTMVKALYKLNENTVSTALQADSEHRFCRWFLGFPIAKYHGVLTQPVYIVDCFHNKCKMYSGRTFLFASRTGFGRTVMEAVAYIPNESAGHICWLVQMCWRHGMKLEDAIFTDQGPFLAAMNALNREFLVSFYTMLCLQHIFRNIHDGFGVLFSDENEKKWFRHMMNTASFCEDQLSFFQTIFDWLNSKISSCLAPRRHLYLTLILYILRLHPGLWTVFGNTPQFSDDYYERYLKNNILPSLFSALFINLNFRSDQHYELAQAFDFLISCRASAVLHTDIFLEKFGSYIIRRSGPCSRLHLARTNIAESQGASFLYCGFRYEPPPRAIPIILNQYNRQIESLKLDLKRTGSGSALTTTGERLKDVVTTHGILYDKSYTTFSGAVSDRNLCGLEILLQESDNDSDDNGDEGESCASGQEAITQQQSQSQLLTFPVSSTNSVDATVSGNGDKFSSFPETQESHDNNFDIKSKGSPQTQQSRDINFDIKSKGSAHECNRSCNTHDESPRQKEDEVRETGSDRSCATRDEVNNQVDGTHQSRNRLGNTNCDDSIASIASDGEIPDNFMQYAAVEGSFKCLDGRQYTAHLKWKFPSMQNHPFNPNYQHQCNLCILHSSMVQIPCYCILSLALYAATQDSRFPKHHIKAVKDRTLPDDFYPTCFLADRNLSLIQSDSCVLKLRIPTQNDLSRYELVEPYLKSPPQYTASIEKGYRTASTGESGKSKKKTRQAGYEGKKKEKKGIYANHNTELVGVCLPIGAMHRAMDGRKNGGRAFETDRDVSEAIADAKVVSTTRLCGGCQQEGHTQINCRAMYSNHTGVVKPNLITTGEYLVYRVQDESSHERLQGKPVELKALSSKDVNSRMFRSYNPDEDPKSLPSQDENKIKKHQKKPVEMSIKGLKAKFGRTVKDISDKTTSCRIAINKRLNMVDWLQTNCIVDDDFVNDDTGIADTYNDTDIERALSLEKVLASTKRIVSCVYTPSIVKFGSQTSMSETEWVMMTVFKIVPESRDVLNTMLLGRNGKSPLSIAKISNNGKSVLSTVTTHNNTFAHNLSETYGSREIIQYFGQRTLAKLRNESDVREIKSNDRIRELLNQKTNSGTEVDPIEIDFKLDDRELSKGILQIFSQIDEGEGEGEGEVDDHCIKVLTPVTQLVVTDLDILTLKPEGWLNDTVISSFFSVLNSTKTIRNPKEILYISTFMFCQLLGISNDEYNYANANRCIRKKDLFGAKVIFVPINIEGSHWILGCIYPGECRIEIYDSGKWIANHLSNKKNINITRAKHYGMALLYLMEDRAKSTQSIFDIKKWSIVDKFCPQQQNSWDCGVSVCVIAFFMSNDLPLNYNHIFLGKRRVDIEFSILLRERCISKKVPTEEQNPNPFLSYDDIAINDLSNVRCHFNIVSRFSPNLTAVISRKVIGILMPFFDNSTWFSFVQCCKVVNRPSLKDFDVSSITDVGITELTDRIDDSDGGIVDDSTEREVTTTGE